jgi:hypothetical protein
MFTVYPPLILVPSPGCQAIYIRCGHVAFRVMQSSVHIAALEEVTGIRSCSSPIAVFGSHVKIVQLKTSAPLVGNFHLDLHQAQRE